MSNLGVRLDGKQKPQVSGAFMAYNTDNKKVKPEDTSVHLAPNSCFEGYFNNNSQNV